MFPPGSRKRTDEPETTIQIEVPSSLFGSLRDLLEGKAIMPMRRRELQGCLLYAREVSLPEAHLDFAELEREAERQGVSVVDVLWDKAGRTQEPR